MNQRQKLTLITAVAALLGIVLILSVVWVVSEEQRFSHYRNKKGGFSIRYPASWAYEENLGGAAVIFFSPQENDLDFFKESVNVVVQDLSANPMELKPYSEIAIEQMRLVFKDNFVILESGLTFISGQPGYKLIFLGKGPENELKYMSVWTIKNQTAYQVTYTALSSQYDRYQLKVKRMLSSFRID